MKILRQIAFAALALTGLCAAAWAIQPGTTGTEKTFQQEGLRSGVLVQKNNTATASAGAATLNAAGSGVITTESLSTLAGSTYTLTLTNSMIAATDIVLASVGNGSNAVGTPAVASITPGAGSVSIVVQNISNNTALSGTLKIGFVVIKQTALGAD